MWNQRYTNDLIRMTVVVRIRVVLVVWVVMEAVVATVVLAIEKQKKVFR